MNTTHLWVLAALGLAAVSVPAASRAGEGKGAATIFREARGYTVRIKTQIETPFLGDERGAYTGAGFLVDAKRGWIVTNAHVVGESPSLVQVAFAGESYQPARKLYVDSFADIAVVTLDRSVPNRRPAALDPTSPIIGEAIGAFGHPLGLPYTGTRGIVSGITSQYGATLIQIDATVDHGNSGGPVIALSDGRILGIATAGAGDDEHDRLNFATPIDDVRAILGLLREGVTPSPPRLPFALLRDEDGRHTLRVAGTFDSVRWPLEAGDRIVAIDGERDSLRELHDLVRGLRGRDGVVGVIVERGEGRLRVAAHPTPRAPLLERRGFSIDGALIAEVDFEDASGPLVARLAIHSVEAASIAETVQLESFDMLVSVDGREFDDLEALIDYVRSRPAGPLALVVRRLSFQNGHFYQYHSRELPCVETRLVQQESLPPLAGK